MSFKIVCDHCQREIGKEYVKIDFYENCKTVLGHFHIDCFNYKFSCDIRKIKDKNK